MNEYKPELHVRIHDSIVFNVVLRRSRHVRVYIQNPFIQSKSPVPSRYQHHLTGLSSRAELPVAQWIKATRFPLQKYH